MNTGPGAGSVALGQEATMTREAHFDGAFAELSAVLVTDFDLGDLLHRLAEACVSICGAVGAGIVVADQDGVLRDVAYSSEQIRRLERVQLQSGQGPCVECFRVGHQVEVPNLAEALERWPRFTSAALQAGIGSARALPLRLRGRTVGALNLFHTEPRACSPEVLRAAQALADLAVVGIVQYGHGPQLAEQVQAHVKGALEARSLIERAKGFVAERSGLTMDESFEHMRRYADREQLGLTQVAQSVSERTLAVQSLLAGETL